MPKESKKKKFVMPKAAIKTDTDRADLIEEMLYLSNDMLEALSEGPSDDAMHDICTLLLSYTDAAAISVTNTKEVMAYVGLGQNRYKSNQRIRTKGTFDVLSSGEGRCFFSAEEIGAGVYDPAIQGAIVEPLAYAGQTVGVLKFYFTNPHDITQSQVSTAQGFARLISTQLAAREVEAQRELSAQMEIKMLQSQINPHFLFNSINTVSSLIRTDPNYARDVLRNFATYFRATLKQTDDFIPLSDEIDIVSNYISLEKARFGDELVLVLDIDDAILENFEVPPFMIQPIVENCVRHARIAGQKLTIRVRARLTDGRVLISIADDGKGMKEKTAESLFQEKENRGEGLGLAMSNVASRIHACFGDHANINVASVEGSGTTIMITLPLTKIDEKEIMKAKNGKN